ncbi:transcription factor HES-2-like [Esox lucius]|uniref:BHLH domain-containing protein n=1 Tax=Esox lucius TaxID=8010 RepID=A0A3P8XKN4_ESOLU|nr:transcription factor HES-2-like [Esox lucius]
MPSESIQSSAPRPTVVRKKETLELRKTMKPLMEKRRRARINDSLNHLKTLILPLTGKDHSRHSKLEKADILEMTVRFLSDLRAAPEKSTSDGYKDGYKACMQRVTGLLPEMNLDKGACQSVNEFIRQCTSPSFNPACLNCCAKSSRSFPSIQQRLLSLKADVGSRIESHSNSLPNRPQASNAMMWRPW